MTTLPKAKAIRPYTEKLITRSIKYAKHPTTNGRVGKIRELFRPIRDRDALSILTKGIPKLFATRPGGYTRIFKLEPRKSDGSAMAIIQLVLDDLGKITPKCNFDVAKCFFDLNAYQQFCRIHVSQGGISKKTRSAWGSVAVPRVEIIADFDSASLEFVDIRELSGFVFPKLANSNLPLVFRVVVTGRKSNETLCPVDVVPEGDAFLSNVNRISGLYEIMLAVPPMQKRIASFKISELNAIDDDGLSFLVYDNSGMAAYAKLWGKDHAR